MRKTLQITILLVCVMFVMTCQIQAGTWVTLDYPGANDTYITGISGNTIVGHADGHGIIYNTVTQNWTTLDVPGVPSGTVICGFDGSNYAGEYSDASGEHGFLYDGLNWTTFEILGWYRANIGGISGGTVAGDYYDLNDEERYGFLYDGTTWTEITTPLGSLKAINGIDGDNLAGWYKDTSGNGHGFFYDGLTWHTIDKPGATTTMIFGIDENNLIGRYWDTSDFYDFLYDGTTWAILDVPGEIHGISGNNIVGSYYDTSGKAHGFVYIIPEPCTFGLFGFGFLIMRRAVKTIRK